MSLKGRDFLTLKDFSQEEIQYLLDLAAELKEKKIQYENLQEQLAELDEVGQEFRENDRKCQAIQLAMDRLQELSETMQKKMKKELLQGRFTKNTVLYQMR